MIDFEKIKRQLVDNAMDHCHGVAASGVHPSEIELQCPTATTVHVFVRGKLKFRVFAQLVHNEDGTKRFFIRHECAEKVVPIKGFEDWFPVSLTAQ